MAGEVEEYAAAQAEYKAAQAELSALSKQLRKVSDALMNPMILRFPNTAHVVPGEGITDRVSVHVDSWKSEEQVRAMLNAFYGARGKLRQTWARVPEALRQAMRPPEY